MKAQLQKLIGIMISSLLLVSACQPAAPTEPAASLLTGTMSEVSGTVDAKKAKTAEFTPVIVGTVLQVADQVQTGEDGRARIDLSSGTIIRVVPSSLFTLQSNEETSGGLKTKSKLDLGQIFIILKGGSMDVETPSGVASVRGSYMMVEVDPTTQDVIISCLEGSCNATNPAGSLDFTNGQKVTLFHFDPATGQYRPPEMEDMSDEDFQKWLDENPEAREVYNQVVAELTAKAPPSPTATNVPPTTTQVAAATATPDACVSLLTPTDASQFSTTGLVQFSWSPRTNASKYRLTIHYPNGGTASIDTTEPSVLRSLDVINIGGNFTWDVTVLDADGAPICQSSSMTFSKQTPEAKDTKVPEEGEPTCRYCNGNQGGY